MQTGDTVRDGHGRVYQVGPLLGRGLWGRSFAARTADASTTEWVIKVPLRASDLGGDRHLADACREIALEQGRLHSGAGRQVADPSALGAQPGGLLGLVARFQLADETPVLVFPKTTTTWEQRLLKAPSLEEVLDIATRVVRTLQGLSAQLPCHGNLKPSNVLLDERGEVRLTDAMTPTLRANLSALLPFHPDSRAWLPPEVRELGGTAVLSSAVDTYAVAMSIYRGAMAAPDGPERHPVLPLDGLDKARLVVLKDRIHNRLQDEHANPRFHARLSDRAAALLNRALSKETSPSPPYRFSRLDEMQSRTAEVLSLVHPGVTHVGRLLIDRAPGLRAFTTDEDVRLTASVACTAGVESHEEIACGLAVFDDDRGERMRDIPCGYSVDRHPSGRFRFRFRLSELPPGSWRVRVAFTIRESGLEPVTAEAIFQVLAAAGYVPPRPEPQTRALPLHRDQEPKTQVTEPGVRPDGQRAWQSSERPSVSGLSTQPGQPAQEPPAPPEERAQRVAVGGGAQVRMPAGSELHGSIEPEDSRPTVVARPAQAQVASARVSHEGIARVRLDAPLSAPRQVGASARVAAPQPAAPRQPGPRMPLQAPVSRETAPRQPQAPGAAAQVSRSPEPRRSEVRIPGPRRSNTADPTATLPPEQAALLRRRRASTHPGGRTEARRTETRRTEPGRPAQAAIPRGAPHEAELPRRRQSSGASISPMGRGALEAPTARVEAVSVEEIEYQGMGRWTDLPLPRVSAEDLPAPEPGPRMVEDTEDEYEDSSMSRFLGDVFELVRGDAFVLFIGAATVLIVLLVGALVALS